MEPRSKTVSTVIRRRCRLSVPKRHARKQRRGCLWITWDPKSAAPHPNVAAICVQLRGSRGSPCHSTKFRIARRPVQSKFRVTEEAISNRQAILSRLRFRPDPTRIESSAPAELLELARTSFNLRLSSAHGLKVKPLRPYKAPEIGSPRARLDSGCIYGPWTVRSSFGSAEEIGWKHSTEGVYRQHGSELRRGDTVVVTIGEGLLNREEKHGRPLFPFGEI